MWCLLSCKDTNFKANHNKRERREAQNEGVCYLAKIRILKQITTFHRRPGLIQGCLLSCKDTNFKANHNIGYVVRIVQNGVCYLAKIRILKQITTQVDIIMDSIVVFVILQRYEF